MSDQSHKAETLRTGQNHLLEMIARGSPLKDILDQLMLLIESQGDGVLCSVMLVDEDGRMHPASGPSLPQEYLAALENLPIGPSVGSCGTAIFRKQAVFVSDISNDPLWAPYKQLAQTHQLQACWSIPILGQEKVFGSFAMYYRHSHNPGPEELKRIDVATHIASIAIERERNEAELRLYRANLEQLVNQRTLELQQTRTELFRSEKLASLGSLVAGVSHELNTPVGNALLSASTLKQRFIELSETIRKGPLKRTDFTAFLEDGQHAATLTVNSLARAIELLQHFKQLAVDQTSDRRRTFTLQNVLDDIISSFSPRLRHTRHHIELEVAEQPIEMDSFPGALGQVLNNLLQNALLHAFEKREQGTIRIAISKAGPDKIRICVDDDGIGIPATLLPRIFDPYFTTKLGQGGSGLGLFIVFNLVTKTLGGSISIQSKEDKGTHISIVLPLNAPTESSHTDEPLSLSA